MFNNRIHILSLLILISCNNLTSENKASSNKDSNNLGNLAVSEENGMNSKDTAGFFSNCQKWTGSSMGFLQEVEASKDSLGPFCFYECYDCKETFEIIFVYKDVKKRGQANHDFIWNEYEKGCVNIFSNFECFAFVYPMRDPDKQKDVHAMNIDFPITVRVYERNTGDNWKFLKKIKVKTFKELSLLQFKTIYRLK